MLSVGHVLSLSTSPWRSFALPFGTNVAPEPDWLEIVNTGDTISISYQRVSLTVLSLEW